MEDFCQILSQDVINALICLVIGAALTSALRVKPRSQQRSTLLNNESLAQSSPGIAKAKAIDDVVVAATFPPALPAEIAASIADMIDLSGIAQLSAANTMLHDQFWNHPVVWRQVAAARCSQEVMEQTGSGDATMAREGFRHAFFRIGGNSPQALLDMARNETNKATEVLEEAARMLSGMMPDDSSSNIQSAIDAGGTALWVHAAREVRAAKAARSFLRVAEQRSDLVMSWQLEHLQDAFQTTQELESSMDLALQKMIDDAESLELDDDFGCPPLNELHHINVMEPK
jgi:hypothetical protein